MARVEERNNSEIGVVILAQKAYIEQILFNN